MHGGRMGLVARVCMGRVDHRRLRTTSHNHQQLPGHYASSSAAQQPPTTTHNNPGHYIILVSSGAVAMGCHRLAIDTKPACMAQRQALAAVGQVRGSWWWWL
jgi:glutamate 5-kinase